MWGPRQAKPGLDTEPPLGSNAGAIELLERNNSGWNVLEKPPLAFANAARP